MAAKVKVREADYAFCLTHNLIIQPGLYWNLAQEVWLHRNGLGSKACVIHYKKLEVK